MEEGYIELEEEVQRWKIKTKKKVKMESNLKKKS